MSRVSVVIPTYNGEAYLESALDSVFSQTHAPDEVVIADDASTDGTSQLVSRISKSAPLPVRLIQLRENSGAPAKPLNFGIKSATGDLIAVLDQDDEFTSSKIEDQMRPLVDDPSIVFACGKSGVHGTKRSGQSPAVRNDLSNLSIKRHQYLKLSGEQVLFLLLKHGCFVGGFPGFMFRRDGWLRCGGLDESFGISADYDFLCRLCRLGDVAFCDRIHYLRREHGSNLCDDRGLVWRENSIVHERYLPVYMAADERPGQLADLREMFLTIAYWCRVYGSYRQSLKFYLRTIPCGGANWRIVKGVAKLAANSFHDLLFGRRL